MRYFEKLRVARTILGAGDHDNKLEDIPQYLEEDITKLEAEIAILTKNDNRLKTGAYQ